jgi:predicted nucleic acid-binding protein
MRNDWRGTVIILIDSNVLIYAYDVRDENRQKQALSVVSTLGGIGSGRLSAQCLAEFFSRTTRGAYPLLTVPIAAEQTALLSLAFSVYPVTSQVVLEAIRGMRDHKFSFWDSQIWAAARLNQVPVVFSEDFNSGAIVEGVRFVNPLAADFMLAEWVS